MLKKYSIFFITLIPIFFICFLIFLVHPENLTLFNPQGLTAQYERNVIILAVSLMLSLAIPVVFITFFVAWKYRSGAKSDYKPDVKHGKLVEAGWWIIPFCMTLILSAITWQTTHALDPYKSLTSQNKPIIIQVIALRWKWLFIYPEQNIATVNYIQFPINTPVSFVLTADGPMSSFWVPSLSGQIYAMTGMATQLHIMTSKPGAYFGASAEINGQGFAGMKFTAIASSRTDFDMWVQSVKRENHVLTMTEYNNLAKPSEDTPQSTYSSTNSGLYNAIIMKYMAPMKGI